jgi:GT2 family glycosyltransferase
VAERLLSVVIPARDAASTLRRTLDALAQQHPRVADEVIVVDNGSHDDTAAIAEASPSVDRVIRRRRGEGPGAARNCGVKAARGTLIAFLDADCRPSAAWLAAGVQALGAADLALGRVVPDPDEYLGPFDRTLGVGGPSPLFESASLFVRRELFDRVGGFPSGLERGGAGPGRAADPFGEDVIFGWRARRAGARTAFCAEALAYHAVFPRGPADYISERARLALFAALAAEVPELRQAFFYRRVFLSSRTAALDLALLGLVGALTRKARGPGVVATAPYLGILATGARRAGLGRAAPVAAVDLLADLRGAIALLAGSLRTGTLVL